MSKSFLIVGSTESGKTELIKKLPEKAHYAEHALNNQEDKLRLLAEIDSKTAIVFCLEVAKLGDKQAIRLIAESIKLIEGQKKPPPIWLVLTKSDQSKKIDNALKRNLQEEFATILEDCIFVTSAQNTSGLATLEAKIHPPASRAQEITQYSFQFKCFTCMAAAGLGILVLAALLFPPIGVISLAVGLIAQFSIFSAVTVVGAAVAGTGLYKAHQAYLHSNMQAGI